MKKINPLIIALALAATSAQAQFLLSTADSLRSHFQVDDCCAMTLELCAARKPQCRIAPRLMNFLTWADSTRRFDPPGLSEALRQRYATFTDPRRPALDFANWPTSGDANAPVTVWVYYSGTCPTCKNNYKALHDAMTVGVLKGKARMVSKPINGGVGAGADVNVVLTAAAEMGRFDDIMLGLVGRTGRIDTTAIYSIAQSRMIDVNRLRTLANSPAVRKRVADAEAESKRENVQYVPTYFINGRRYDSRLDVRWVIDAIEYEFDNVRSKR